MPLIIVLAESALETIPKQIINHPLIQRHAKKKGKKPSEILLDTSYHYAAMKKLKEKWKRGRPDIIHITLLQILGSPANLQGQLRVYVHTRNNKVIYINPETRLPRNYLRFTGLIEQLFKTGRVPPKSEKPLLQIKNKTLKNLMKEIKPTKTIILTSEGKPTTPEKITEEIVKEEKPAIIIGGFPHGEFREETLKLSDEKLAIYPKPLETWIVASSIIHAYEVKKGIYERAWREEI